MGSAALAAAVPYPGKATRIVRKGQRTTTPLLPPPTTTTTTTTTTKRRLYHPKPVG